MQREPAGELAAPERLAWPGFVLDLGRGELLDDRGRPTELRAQALKLLLILGERAGQVVGKDELMRRVWGDVVVTEDSLVQAVGDIRRVLGDAKHERVRTVPRRGYLLVVDRPQAAAAAADSTGVTVAAPMPFRRAGGAAWLGVAGLLLAVFVAGWMAARSGGSAFHAARSLAILPFESEAGTEDWFVGGVALDLTTHLASWPEVRVVGRGSTAHYKGRNVDPREVGRDLNVAHVLTGRARRDGDTVRLAVSLVETRGGGTVWSELRDVPRGDLNRLVGDIAGGLARTLVVAYGDAASAHSQMLGPRQIEADDLALQGYAELLRSVSREGFERSRQLFEQALLLDPKSRRALNGVVLSNINLVLWQWSDDPERAVARAREALAQAEIIAPDHLGTWLARASMFYPRQDWAGLAAIADHLVQHFPNEPASYHHRCSALLRLARFEQCIAACARATEISPRDSRVPTWQGLSGFAYLQLGRWAEAERSLRQSVIGNPRVAFYQVALATAVAEQGREDEARQVMGEAMLRFPAFRRSAIASYWVASDARFQAGRDRLIARAADLGLPP